jgi:hypothetical protein
MTETGRLVVLRDIKPLVSAIADLVANAVETRPLPLPSGRPRYRRRDEDLGRLPRNASLRLIVARQINRLRVDVTQGGVDRRIHPKKVVPAPSLAQRTEVVKEECRDCAHLHGTLPIRECGDG